VIVRVPAEVFRTYLIDACRFNPLAPFLTIHAARLVRAVAVLPAQQRRRWRGSQPGW
jgi:hypothetical protein